MAQYIPFDTGVEVRGESVLSICNGVNDFFRPILKKIMHKNNIINPEPARWYNQVDWLNTFKEIDEEIGPHALYLIGKAIPDNAIFPQGISNLKDALLSIDKAYHNNHRGGEIGYYKLLKWDNQNKKAQFECKNPYSCHFDRGIITKITEKFKPKDSAGIEVFLAPSTQGRLEGKDKSLYFITW